MKKISYILALTALMLMIGAFNASATLTTSKVYDRLHSTFGDVNQLASNPKHEDTSRRDVFVTATIPISNSDVSDVKAVLKVQSASPFTLSDLQIVNQTDLTFPANSTDTPITFQARIPEKLDAVDTKNNPVALKVATLVFQDPANPNVELGRIDVFMQREDNLDLSNVGGTINSVGKKSLGTDDTLKNLKPGDHVELEGKATNKFERRSNVDVRSITLEVQCDNENDFSFDEKNVDVGDLAPNDKETQTISLDVEKDASDDTASCDLMLSGEDQNGAHHGESIKFNLEVNRKSHDIQIPTVTARPNSLSCTDKEIQLTVDLLNLGRSNEKRVAVEVTSKAISFQDRIANIELDQDDSTQEIFLIPINPTTLNAGPFVIQAQSFYDNTKSANTETIQIDNLCTTGNKGESTDTTKKTDGSVVVQGALELDSDNIKINLGSSTSIPVKVTNMEKTPVEYMLTLADTTDFAEQATSKTVFLNPGQQSTVLLNIKSKPKIDLGKYSGVIVLKDNAGKTLETKTFTVDVEAKQSSGSSFDITSLFSGSDSRVFWIIGVIILVVVAIFFIRLIFTGGRRNKQQQPTPKKFADYEAAAGKKPKRRR